MKETLKRLITDFQERPLPTLIPRELEIPLGVEKIVSLIGVRRCGKTSLLLDTIRKLRSQVPAQRIVYLNFEDDRLYGLQLKDLGLILESYFELYPQEMGKPVWWFFDEIQDIPGWERFIRRMDDTENGYIYITGSSSKLLSSEIATTLRGRTITYEVFPFSFSEYLAATNTTVNLHSTNSIRHIHHHFNHYLIHGGFAETFNQSEEVERRILTDYLDLVIYRDLIERYNVTNRTLLKHLIRHLFANPATLVSFNKLYNQFKSQGFKLSKDTLFDYFTHLNDAYAVFSVPIFRRSVHDQQRNPKKSYIIDNSYKQLFDAFSSRDLGKLYENLVFLQLRRENREIYYFKEKYEVDFITQNQLINVTHSLEDPQTRKREIRSLQEAMEALQTEEATLITADQEETHSVKQGTIHLIPLWKWLLNREKFTQ
ncbi:MAG: ATP-binding protein [Sedimenticola sp.]